MLSLVSGEWRILARIPGRDAEHRERAGAGPRLRASVRVTVSGFETWHRATGLAGGPGSYSARVRVLITGSSGKLGHALSRRLAGDGHTVAGIDVVPGAYTVHVGSINEREPVRALVQGADAVVHTASLHAPHVGQRTREEFIEINVQGTLHLLEASVAAGVGRFVYTSTTSLYGHAMVPRERAVWVTEELAPRPRDIYDITKLAAEQLCQDVAAEAGLPVWCLRTARFWDEPMHLQVIYRLYRGVDVEDAVDAHVLALHAPAARAGVFNISARSPFQERDTADLLRDAAAVIRARHPEAEAIFQAHGLELPRSIDRVYVTGRAEAELGYAPSRNFDHILRRWQEPGTRPSGHVHPAK